MSLRRILAAVSQTIWKACVLGLPVGPGGYCRFAMYQSLEGHFRAAPLSPNGKVLSISHSLDLAELIGTRPFEVEEANYPGASILSLPFENESFDLVVSDQVFEHIQGDPQTAIAECLRVLKPGGKMVHTTCFLIPYHGPGDYWRFSTEGLAYLCRDASEVELAGGWGHPYIAILGGLGLLDAPVPVARWHPFHWLATLNRASYAYTVWVVARK